MLQGLSLDATGAERRERSGVDPGALTALRAARPIVDGLDRAERRRLAAVVACVAGPREQGMLTAQLVVGALALGRCLPLHVTGLGSCGLFTALHVAQALLGRSPEALVLVIRTDAAGCARDSSGALLLATRGGVVCRPLPPGRAALPADASPTDSAELCGPALALSLARAGFRAGDVQRVAHVATLEAAMGAAVQTPPVVSTLLWSRDPDGSLGACLLEPG